MKYLKELDELQITLDILKVSLYSFLFILFIIINLIVIITFFQVYNRSP